MTEYYLKNRKPVRFEDKIMDNPMGYIEVFRRRCGMGQLKIRKTYFNNCIASTIFLGFDHGIDDNKPVLFETMIFGGDNDGYQTRCCTHRQALAMHREAVKLIKKEKYDSK
tara:strand:+ start:2960 stop:3292 length:333 start_codon:yes stop_codon:yes gene_type:complete